MPSIVCNKVTDTMVVKSGDIQSNGESTPQKRRLRSNSAQHDSPVPSTPSPSPMNWKSPSPVSWKSPRRCTSDSPNSNTTMEGAEKISASKLVKSCKSLVNIMSESSDKLAWNPKDKEQVKKVKEALHVSSAQQTVVCREDEQRRVLELCKRCLEREEAGSLYASGCPGTGKSLSMEKVKEGLIDWTKEAGFQPPDMLAINCTSLTNTSDIFRKILDKIQPRRKTNARTSPLQHLQNLYSRKQQSPCMKMMLIIADELDYLITRDRAVLHDLFMLTTLPFSRCILIGIANAIDLADRFLPKLQSLNCKPMVITFRAYSKDQIIAILQRRLMALPYMVFKSQALELCARKVAAASGDMRRALCVCRSAIEILEAELKESMGNSKLSTEEMGLSDQPETIPRDLLENQETNVVGVAHMAAALSKAFRSPVVDTIQSLPQHQQIILCAAVKHFRTGKKDTTLGELNKSYADICKSTLIPPLGITELSNMCRVLADQGLLKLGQSREDKLRRVTLKVDEADISFALQGVRFFRNCLQ